MARSKKTEVSESTKGAARMKRVYCLKSQRLEWGNLLKKAYVAYRCTKCGQEHTS